MRVKVLAKQIRQNYYCVAVGYCGLQALLQYESTQFYCAGVHGWNFDAYCFDLHGVNVCITTGYRGMVHNIEKKPTYKEIQSYEKKAEQICADDIGDKKDRLHKLVCEFLEFAFAEVLK